MRVSAAIALSLLLGLCGCALFKSKPPPPRPRPLFEGRTATLDITNGIRIAGAVELPRGFTPGSAPMWLAQSTVIGIAGTIGQNAVVLGYGGDRFAQMTIIANDLGPGAPDGRIVAVAASPDGMELTTAVAAADAQRLDLVVIDTLSGGAGHVVTSFDGDYRVASLGWLDRTTIAIVIRGTAAAAENAAVEDASSGLYAVSISGVGAVAHFDQVRCRLGRLSFSPDRRFAVSEGDRDVAPAIIDLHTQSCVEIRATPPLSVLGWAPDSSAFIYAASDRDGKNTGVYRLTLATAQRTVVAVSSGAAAYASDGTIVAMGNSRLSWKAVALDPAAPVKAEIALLNPQTAELNFNSLGFQTSPAMFARSAMDFTAASDSAAIDALVPQSGGLLRELIDYSYPSRSAFVLASGPAIGPLLTSWSDDGRALAVVDGDASLARLTVLLPPQ